MTASSLREDRSNPQVEGWACRLGNAGFLLFEAGLRPARDHTGSRKSTGILRVVFCILSVLKSDPIVVEGITLVKAISRPFSSISPTAASKLALHSL